MAQMAILEKIARNAEQLGLTVTRGTSSVVIDNGSNDLTVSLVEADIMKPMGGIDNTASPFIGIGVANPCKIKMKSAISTADTVADVIDGTVALKVFQLISRFANDITLENSDAAYSLTLRGTVDLIGVGQ